MPDIGLNFNCGSGEVLPFGHVTEGPIGVCGDTCKHQRASDLAQGSIILQETVTNFSCPGACRSQAFSPPGTISIVDVVIGGSGTFVRATGH